RGDRRRTQSRRACRNDEDSAAPGRASARAEVVRQDPGALRRRATATNVLSQAWRTRAAWTGGAARRVQGTERSGSPGAYSSAGAARDERATPGPGAVDHATRVARVRSLGPRHGESPVAAFVRAGHRNDAGEFRPERRAAHASRIVALAGRRV